MKLKATDSGSDGPHGPQGDQAVASREEVSTGQAAGTAAALEKANDQEDASKKENA